MKRVPTRNAVNRTPSGESRRHTPALVAAAAIAALLPGTVYAYVGPGAGLTAIGTVLALFAAVALAVVGFIWYPLKRLLARRQRVSNRADADADAELAHRSVPASDAVSPEDTHSASKRR